MGLSGVKLTHSRTEDQRLSPTQTVFPQPFEFRLGIQTVLQRLNDQEAHNLPSVLTIGSLGANSVGHVFGQAQRQFKYPVCGQRIGIMEAIAIDVAVYSKCLDHIHAWTEWTAIGMHHLNNPSTKFGWRRGLTFGYRQVGVLHSSP